SDMCHTVKRDQVVLAGGIQRNLFDQHQLVVLLVKGSVQHGIRVGIEAGEHLLVAAGYGGRRVRQPVPVRILSDRVEQFADSRFGARLIEDSSVQGRRSGIRAHHRRLRSFQPCADGLDGLGSPPCGSAAGPASGAGVPGGGYGGYGGGGGPPPGGGGGGPGAGGGGGGGGGGARPRGWPPAGVVG